MKIQTMRTNCQLVNLFLGLFSRYAAIRDIGSRVTRAEFTVHCICIWEKLSYLHILSHSSISTRTISADWYLRKHQTAPVRAAASIDKYGRVHVYPNGVHVYLNLVQQLSLASVHPCTQIRMEGYTPSTHKNPQHFRCGCTPLHPHLDAPGEHRQHPPLHMPVTTLH